MTKQVGAEGLDFGRCNLVIAFDLPHNVVEYMQVGATWGDAGYKQVHTMWSST